MPSDLRNCERFTIPYKERYILQAVLVAPPGRRCQETKGSLHTINNNDYLEGGGFFVASIFRTRKLLDVLDAGDWSLLSMSDPS